MGAGETPEFSNLFWNCYMYVCGSKWKTDVGPQMWMSSLVLTIQLLGYLILTHTHMFIHQKKMVIQPTSNLSSWLPNLTHPGDVFGNTVAMCSEQVAIDGWRWCENLWHYFPGSWNNDCATPKDRFSKDGEKCCFFTTKIFRFSKAGATGKKNEDAKQPSIASWGRKKNFSH